MDKETREIKKRWTSVRLKGVFNMILSYTLLHLALHRHIQASILWRPGWSRPPVEVLGVLNPSWPSPCATVQLIGLLSPIHTFLDTTVSLKTQTGFIFDLLLSPKLGNCARSGTLFFLTPIRILSYLSFPFHPSIFFHPSSSPSLPHSLLFT